jgi:pimeloyl-ACP methyl ester carboxylesterase
VPYVSNARVRLYFELAGAGFPVVLHTGGAGDSMMWQYAGYVDGLAGFQCLLLDHRGHGFSDRPHALEDHRMEDYVADVVALLDALELPQVAFWGYSAGAQVGYALAADHPERVAGLIASGAIGPADRSYPAEQKGNSELARQVREQGMEALEQALEAGEDRALPDWLCWQFSETEPEMLALHLLAWNDWRGPWSLLERVTAPTLMLVGEREDPAGDTRRAAALMRNARCVTLPGLGHVGAFLHSDLALPHATALLRTVAEGLTAGGGQQSR